MNVMNNAALLKSVIFKCEEVLSLSQVLLWYLVSQKRLQRSIVKEKQ